MANIKITDLDAYTNPDSTDVLPIVDVDGDTTKKVTIADLMENAGAGTAALPGIAFDGDPNTGIYRPAADQIALSTAGVQRLLIDDSGDVTIPGGLEVQGTTTYISTTNLQVEDKNIELGKVGTPSDTTADGGGITLLGTTNHTINWSNSGDSWDFSEHVNIASGKEFKIAGTSVLSNNTLGSGVTASSLTSVGTITTGVWNGTALTSDYIGTAAVTTAKIADDAVNADKLANTAVTAGSYTAADITVDAQGRITAAANGTLGTAEIADSAVTTAKIADTAVSTAKIADDAVTADKLANTAVTAGSYTSADITVDAQGRITAASSSAGSVQDKIEEGDSKVEVTDTGSDGTITFTTDAASRMTINNSGKVTINADSEISGHTIGKGNNSHQSNVAVGNGVLAAATGNARGNVGVGLSALADVTDGDDNVGIGQNAGADITTGVRNIAIGASSLGVGTTAGSNVGVGAYSLLATTSGTENIAIGERSLQANTSGVRNIGIGVYGLANVTDGDNNIGIGRDAGNTITTGSDNINIGKNAGRGVTTGSNNVFIGGHTYSSAYATDLANTVVIGPIGTERLRIDSSGNVGIGSSSPSQLLDLKGSSASLALTTTGASDTSQIYWRDSADAIQGYLRYDHSGESLAFAVNGASEKMRIDSNGNVGIGDSSLDSLSARTSIGYRSLRVQNANITAAGGSYAMFGVNYYQHTDGVVKYIDAGYSGRIETWGDYIAFHLSNGAAADDNISNSERMRIDSSGRLLVGTSSSRTSGTADIIQGSHVSGSNIILNRQVSATGSAGDYIGGIKFYSYAGSASEEHARVWCQADANTGSGDKPGRLIFSTTIDGGSSPTERLRIASTGAFGLSGANYGTSGQVLTSQGSGSAPQWASPSAVIVKGSSVSFSSVTDVEFTGIASNVCRIIFAVDAISSNGTSPMTLELGHSGGYTTSGYVAWVKRMGGSSFNTASQLTSAFDLTGSVAASENYSGVIELLNGNGNSWVCNVNLQGSADNRKLAGGRVTVGGTLTKLKFDNGGSTYDDGHVRMYTFTEA